MNCLGYYGIGLKQVWVHHSFVYFPGRKKNPGERLKENVKIKEIWAAHRPPLQHPARKFLHSNSLHVLGRAHWLKKMEETGLNFWNVEEEDEEENDDEEGLILRRLMWKTATIPGSGESLMIEIGREAEFRVEGHPRGCFLGKRKWRSLSAAFPFGWTTVSSRWSQGEPIIHRRVSAMVSSICKWKFHCWIHHYLRTCSCNACDWWKSTMPKKSSSILNLGKWW